MRGVRLGATLGPACDAPGVVAGLLRAGLRFARLNFSHGGPEGARARARALRRAASQAGRPVELVGDLQGPRLRIGSLPGGAIDLPTGTEVVLLAGAERAPDGGIPLPHPALARHARRGTILHLDDGALRLRVESIRGPRLRCVVERGGRLSDRKGVNASGVAPASSPLTAKDRRDLDLAVALRCDALLLSFVRRAADVRLARKLVERAGAGAPMAIVAKIERPEAMDRLREIVEAADGVLVARGDLGVEFPLETLPTLQREILAAARDAGKPAIVAAHLLHSMTVADRPTRSEVADVAHAVYDGADGLLLTAETATGANPVEVMRSLSRIAREAGRGSGRRTWWS